MALPRYEGGQVPVGKSGASMAYQAQANTVDTFVQSIQGIKRGAIQTVEQQSIERAKQDAEAAFTERGLKAEVNRDMSIYGQQYNNTLDSLHKKQISIDTGKRFDQLFQESKDNPALFETTAEAYRQETIKNLPEHLKADFTIDFEANKAHYSGAVSKNRLDKIRAQDKEITFALFNESSNKATQAMRDRNQNLALYEIEKAARTIEDAYDNGNISEKERSDKLDSLFFDTSKANFKGVNDGYIDRGDLEGAQNNIDKFRKSKVEGFSDEQRERLADEMQADLNRVITKNDVASRTSQKNDNATAKELIFLQDNGQEVEVERLTTALNSNLSDDVKDELVRAIGDYNQMALFNSVGLSEQSAIMDELDKRPNKTEDEYRLQVKMGKAFQQSMKDIKKDGLSYSKGKAFDGELAPVDFTNPESIQQRISQVNKATTFTGRQQPLYTKAELDSIKENMVTMTPSEKSKLSIMINGLPEDIAGATFSKLGGVFAVAGTHIDSNVSSKIFAGEELLKSKIISSKKDVRISLSTKTKEALGVASTENRSDIIKSIEAWMAFEADRTGVEIDSVSEDDAIEAVVGGKYEYGYLNPFEANREMFLPYPGVTSADFFEWKDSLKREDFGGAFGTLTLREADILKNGDFIYAGNGKYQIMVGNSKATYTDENGEEKPYVVRYPKP